MAKMFFGNFLLACYLLLGFTPLGAQAQQSVILATTTSTQDSGLLDALIPVFEKQSGYFVKTIAVGSGQAMAMGRRGEADALLVHSPDAEIQFVNEGFGVNRRIVMHNDFVVLGPKNDPASVKSAKDALDAFTRIAKSESLFFSRADESGTHALEKKLWKSALINPGGGWYQETGLGMGQTLAVAAEKRGYTLSDRGTYLALQKNLGLEIISQGDPILMNIYHVIEVNPEKFPKVNAKAARQFADFCVSEAAQKIIADFGKDKYGSPLFFPDAIKASAPEK
ncbi:MAG: substrate-binding domain-containing protein [Holophagales bacterium]|jgi:tungstate transport system substrate-binding protein|nr:substrate-binding domain-containing protein [Holophagales bacterium]